MARKQMRLLVDVADLRAFNPGLSRKCVPCGLHRGGARGPVAGEPAAQQYLATWGDARA